jgi:hypothetical protein
MKTEEDEAFDDMARKQGMWGGGFNAKRQAAMDKVNSHFDAAYKKMHEDRAKLFEGQMNYGSSWSKNGERIDPASVYFEQPAQEPMATVTATVTSESGNPDVTMSWWHEPALPVGTKLYTAPPQRPWVGLTDGEVTEGVCRTRYALQTAVAWVDGVEWATKQLKEKNNGL